MGVIAALLYVRRYEKDNQEYSADIDLSLIYGLIGGVVGAKILYLLVNIGEFISEFHFLFSNTGVFLTKYLCGGFVYFGGLFGFLLAIYLYAKAVRIPFGTLVNPAIPALALFHAFGRIGCFCAGCCYGKPTESVLGIVNHCSEIAPNGIPLIPVQLFESAAEIILFILLTALQKKQMSGEKILNIYFLLYGLTRFFLEFMRGDIERGFIGVFSISQIIAALCVLGSFVSFFQKYINAK